MGVAVCASRTDAPHKLTDLDLPVISTDFNRLVSFLSERTRTVPLFFTKTYQLLPLNPNHQFLFKISLFAKATINNSKSSMTSTSI